MTNDIFLQYADMPTTVKSFVRANPDGSYTIVINARLSVDSRQERYKHELRHIKDGDFDYGNETSVQEIELRTHDLMKDVPPVKCYVTDAEIRRKIEQIRRHRRRIQKAMRKRKKKVEELERMGYDFFAAAEEQRLDPERNIFIY